MNIPEFRKCGGSEQFNTGNSRCPYIPEEIKAILLVESGYTLPDELTFESLRMAIHADRPERIYPLLTMVEYSTSGGEGEVSATGYGPNKLTGYSAKTDTFELEQRNQAIVTALMKMKNVSFTAYYVDKNGLIVGQRGAEGAFTGIELSGIYPGGQDLASSGQTAQLTVNLLIKDIERAMANREFKQAKFDILAGLNGLIDVQLIEVETGKFKIRGVYDHLDMTSYYKETLLAIANWVGATAVAYDDNDEAFIVTGDDIRLAPPSVLYQNSVFGIEQVNAA